MWGIGRCQPKSTKFWLDERDPFWRPTVQPVAVTRIFLILENC
jgi:hypothetical protein